MIITEILMTLSPNTLLVRWNQFNPTKELTNLISRVAIEEIRTRTEERAENIAFTANKHQSRKISKKATLNQTSLLPQIRTLDQGMQKLKNNSIKRKKKEQSCLQNII